MEIFASDIYQTLRCENSKTRINSKCEESRLLLIDFKVGICNVRVQREPLKHSSADLIRANETLARIHDIVVV